MRFLDNVLQDFIDNAPAAHGARQILGHARALRRPGRDGLSFLPAGAERAVRKRDGQGRGTCACSSTSARGADAASQMLADERGACPDAAEYGMRSASATRSPSRPPPRSRSSAATPRAGIEPIAGQCVHAEDPVGRLHRAQPAICRNCWREGRMTRRDLVLDHRASKGSVQHLDFLSAGREGRLSRPPSNSISAGSSSTRPTARRSSARASR